MRALPVCLVVLALVACGLGQEWLGQERVSELDSTIDSQPSIALDSIGHAWVVWHGYGVGYSRAYSRWLGARWDEERGVGSDPPGVLTSFKPRMAFDMEGRVWLVWRRKYAGYGGDDIAFCRWQDTCWGPEAQVNQPDSNDLDFSPRIACGGGEVWCVWYGGTYQPNPQTVYASRWDSIAGVWGSEMPVSPPDGNSHWFCDVKVDVYGTPHVVWCTEPLYMVFYSYFDGSRWAPPVPVNDTAAVQASPRADPHLAIDRDGVMHLSFTGAWVGAMTRDIFYSRNDGTGWAEPQMVTQDSAYQEWYSAIAARSVDDVWVVWDRQGEGPDQFRVYASHFDGRKWLPEERLDDDSAFYDGLPEVVLDSTGQPWAVWCGKPYGRGADWDVYSNRRPSAPGVGAGRVCTELQRVALEVRSPAACPIAVRCWLPAGLCATVSVYDVAGRLVSSRYVGPASSGWYNTEVVGFLPLGTYFCSLSAGATVLIRKFVIVGL